MKKIVVESPLAGHGTNAADDFARNIRYARLCCLDCVRRGEAPYASHLFFTQFLDDERPDERRTGMEGGFLWGAAGDGIAVYEDLGVSRGMREGVVRAMARGQPVEFRTLPTDLMALLDQGPPTKTSGI